MAPVTTTKVFEAELIESDSANENSSFNPFEAPSFSETNDVEISAGIGRASESQIRSVIRYLAASELSFILLWISWVVSKVEPNQTTILICTVMIAVAWFCFALMVCSHGEFDLVSVLTILSFPVPVLGLFMFFAGKKQACRFLIWNGYQPTFLGAKPDHAEIAVMNSDPLYRPSAWFKRDGSRRNRFFSLNDFFIVGLLAFSGVIVVVSMLL